MLMQYSINVDAQFPFMLMLSKYDAAQWLRGSVGLFSDSRTDRCHLWVNVPRVTIFPPLFMPIFFFRITDMKSFSSRLSVTFHDHFKGDSSTTFYVIFFGQQRPKKLTHFLSDPAKIFLSDLQKIFFYPTCRTRFLLEPTRKMPTVFSPCSSRYLIGIGIRWQVQQRHRQFYTTWCRCLRH